MKESPFLCPKGIQYGSVDKTTLPLGTAPRVRDKKWLRSAKDKACEVCGSTDGVVAAHFNVAGTVGTGIKAGDDQTAFLCQKHHQEADSSLNRAEWWGLNICRKLLADRYRSETNG